MGSDSSRKLLGFTSRGGEAPFLNPNDVHIVGIDIKETPDNWFAHCSRLKDETEDALAEYIEDVRRSGKIDEPIDGYRDGNRVVVLDGRRSCRVARIIWNEQAKKGVPVADRISVRVILRSGTAEELFRYNVDSHKKKALTVTQKARLMANFHNATGEDFEKTAVMFGYTTTTVKNTLAHFQLDPILQRGVDSGELPIRESIKLAKLSREEQREHYAKMRAKGATHGSRAANSIEAAKKGTPEKIGTDTTRMRPRGFLSTWCDELKKKIDDPEVQIFEKALRFVLGGSVNDLSDTIKETLITAGFKGGGKDSPMAKRLETIRHVANGKMNGAKEEEEMEVEEADA